MHTKTELEALPIEELTTMAKTLDIPTKKDTEKLDLIYSIIEAELSQTPTPAETKQPKKRGRTQQGESNSLDGNDEPPVPVAGQDRIEQQRFTAQVRGADEFTDLVRAVDPPVFVQQFLRRFRIVPRDHRRGIREPDI